jgi:multidrug efflux pump subunit AcrB
MIVMGMIVDNAIVVVDGSLVRLQQGDSRFSSMVNPARETAWPLLGATVISCLAFLPIYLSPDESSDYLGCLFHVVSAALLTSWLLALSQTPVFCHMFLKIKTTSQGIDPFSGKVYGIYRWILEFALRHRWMTLAVMAAMLGFSIYGFQFIPKMFYTESDKAQFFIDYWLPEGERIQSVANDIKVLEDYLMPLREVRNVAACIGSGPPRYMKGIHPELRWPNYAQVIVNVYDYRSISGLVSQLDTWFKEHLPDADPRIRTYYNGPPYDFKLEARFSGPDPQVLRDLADRARRIMRADPQTKYVRDDWRQRVPVLNLRYSQQKARKAGIQRTDVALTTMSLTDGQPICLYREHNDLVPILIKTQTPDLKHVTHLENAPVWGSGPVAVPLSQTLSSTKISWEDPLIRRHNRRRAIKVQCEPVSITGEQLFNRISPKVASITLPSGYSLEWAGEHELAKNEGKGVAKGLPPVLISIALILVFLFGGLRQPLIIVLIIPLAVVGITMGLLVTGVGFSFVSLIGAFSLIGMLIKNAVVLLDRIDTEIRLGKDPYQAVRDASVSRMRPVMMASVTTIFGMAPLLWDPLFATMAATIMFGLAFASLLTLFVVPVLYTLFFRIRNVPIAQTLEEG